MVDARSLYDHLATTGSIPKERQTLIDLPVARDLAEQGSIQLRWVPTTHMLADMLTKFMPTPDKVAQLLRKQVVSLVPSTEEEEHEAHLRGLRQGQRQRRKARSKGTPA